MFNFDDCLNDYFKQTASYKAPLFEPSLGLLDEMTFPSFANLSDYHDPSELYYTFGKSVIHPKRHWGFFGEIVADQSIVRPRVIIKTRFAEQFAVAFHPDTEAMTFSYKDLQVGNTLLILYAQRKTFFDLTDGVRQESMDTCFIFKATLEEVLLESKSALKNYDNLEKTCSFCNNSNSEISLKLCGNCKIQRYCSKDCQVSAWKTHKKICKDMEILLRVSTIGRYRFNTNSYDRGFYNMLRLPPYKGLENSNK